MKKIHPIDLEKAAEGEAFGALAVGRLGRKIPNGVDSSNPQLSVFLEWLLSVAREAHADRSPLKAKGFSLKLSHHGHKEILSVSKV